MSNTLIIAREVPSRMTQSEFNELSEKQYVRVTELLTINGGTRYNVTIHGHPRTITITGA